MHVLVTSDTLGGTWAYTRELVTGLVSRGTRVTLVSFGEIPLPQQTSWMDHLHGLEYRPTAFRLDWMDEGQRDLAESSAYLTGLVKELKPNLLHLNQLCYGSLPVAMPRVVVAHGDFITWWKAVHGREPKQDSWLDCYRDAVKRGLALAECCRGALGMDAAPPSTSVTPAPSTDTVIYNGRNPMVSFNPYVRKDDSVLAVGRLL